MNKTLAYSGIVLLALCGLVGVVILMALGIDAAPFIGLFTPTLATAITAAVTLYGLEKVQEQNAKISRSVNGNTAKLLSLIQRESLTPDEAAELARIENEARDMMSGIRGDHVAG